MLNKWTRPDYSARPIKNCDFKLLDIEVPTCINDTKLIRSFDRLGYFEKYASTLEPTFIIYFHFSQSQHKAILTAVQLLPTSHQCLSMYTLASVKVNIIHSEIWASLIKECCQFRQVFVLPGYQRIFFTISFASSLNHYCYFELSVLHTKRLSNNCKNVQRCLTKR